MNEAPENTEEATEDCDEHEEAVSDDSAENLEEAKVEYNEPDESEDVGMAMGM